ncbi:hypothetical protein MLD38_024230 [Melastoma candidum]|uniref:Uncharacterized protein n=1 Tax=Melastoma candidum TaxID=119954 RepID=A0ACB9NWM9_9MYRT|nr:hypothetical protein MLD38_024230 [Melastoma candidum]
MCPVQLMVAPTVDFISTSLVLIYLQIWIYPTHDETKISLSHFAPFTRVHLLPKPLGRSFTFAMTAMCSFISSAQIYQPRSSTHAMNTPSTSTSPIFLLNWKIQYICHAASYFCKECRLQLHVDFVLWFECSVQHKWHWHKLVLRPPPKEETHKYYCKVCAEGGTSPCGSTTAQVAITWITSAALTQTFPMAIPRIS